MVILITISGCFTGNNSSDESFVAEVEPIPFLDINEIKDSITINLEDITEWFEFVRLETKKFSLLGGNFHSIIIDENNILVTGFEHAENLLQFS